MHSKRVLFLIVGLVSAALVVAAVPVGAASSKVKLAPILSGYKRPLLVANHGGPGRVIFIVEQGGRIKRANYKNGAYKKMGTFLDISDRVNDPTEEFRNEQGLLGLAFHPRYKRNGRFYVSYTRLDDGDKNGDMVIAEFRRANAGAANPASERLVMLLEKDEWNHNGGHLTFGPDDMLYIGLGDGGDDEDVERNGQNLGTPWGSVLRIDPSDPDGGGPATHSVPPGNPYVGKAGLDEIWAHGMRQPWRFSFDRANGNLWLADVGEKQREEVNKAKSNRFGKGAGRGKNYGWSDCEGSLEFHDDEGDGDNRCSSHVLPTYEYARVPAKGWCSVTGGYVHRGPGANKWRGLYVAGDFCGGVFVLSQAGKRKWKTDTGVRISSFGEDAAGRIFATGIFDGRIYRVKFQGPRP